MSHVNSPDSQTSTVARRVLKLLKWLLISVPLGVIGYMQGPAAFEDIHRRACAWPEFPRSIAHWFGDCSVATVAVPVATPPARPVGFESAVELPASYPNEYWRAASPDEIRWMEGDWCFQTINFRSRMAIRDGVVERTVASSIDRTAQPSFEGKRVTRYHAYVSSRGLYRLRDVEQKEAGIYLQHDAAQPRVLQEFSRGIADDGSVRTDKKFLVLDCNRCTVTRDDDLDVYTCR